MQISLRTDLAESIKLKWLQLITDSPEVVDWEAFTNELQQIQPGSDTTFDFETTRIGQIKWINGYWYGSILDDPNQQNIPLDPDQIPDFLGINQTLTKQFPDHTTDEPEIVFGKKRNTKGIIVLLCFTLIASVLFQITYQQFQSSDRHDLPDYTIVANFDSTLDLLKGKYFSGLDKDDSYIEIRTDKSIHMYVITQTEPELESFIDERWVITEIGTNSNGFVIILNDELAMTIDSNQQILDFYEDTFKRI